MIVSDLFLLAALAAVAAISSFAGYWYGRDDGYKQGRADQSRADRVTRLR